LVTLPVISIFGHPSNCHTTVLVGWDELVLDDIVPEQHGIRLCCARMKHKKRNIGKKRFASQRSNLSSPSQASKQDDEALRFGSDASPEKSRARKKNKVQGKELHDICALIELTIEVLARLIRDICTKKWQVEKVEMIEKRESANGAV